MAWPITIDKSLRTFMRTIDVVVTGFFSPAAIAAIGLADLYARFPTRIGSGVGGAAIAMSSQDTGSGQLSNRNESITQAVLLGFFLGIPMAIFGVSFGYWAISILGAPDNVAQMGGVYLAIIFVTSPARHVGYISSAALQGTGDTRTPMKINAIGNIINIIITVVLGFGIGTFPTLQIIGVGIGTATGNVLTAIFFLYSIYSSNDLSFVTPRSSTILKQLLRISAPRVTEGISRNFAEFPFNAILLLFGVEVNAAWQVARRLYQQITAPPNRAANAVSSIIIGQFIGEEKYTDAKFNARGIVFLAVILITPIGVLLVIFPNFFVSIFTSDVTTVEHAVAFTIAYGLSAGFESIFRVFSGVLQGAGDTKKPLYAELIAVFSSYILFTYLFGVYFEYGVVAAYAAILLHNIVRALFVAISFYRGEWITYAENLMEARGSI